jgi:hypothetical protein
MKNSIAMQDLTFTSSPTHIEAIGRNQGNKITYEVRNIRRYINTQGASMIEYKLYSPKTYRKNNVYYVSFGVGGNNTNISLSDRLAPTTFNQ